jgi:carbonic anhydrase
MKKLIQGIVEFRRNVQQDYREAFGRLATGQSPDTLFIACSDSRVVPNTFASTNPGDLFVLRNVGNLIPPCGQHGVSTSDEAEAAAIEFSVLRLNVSDIIVCGHSECGAMRAIMKDRDKIPMPNLRNWLRHGDPALERLQAGNVLDPKLAPHNQLSQLNVLLQMEHVKSYPAVKKRVEAGTLGIHGWWFDIANADVYSYEPCLNRFVLIDEQEATRLVQRLDGEAPPCPQKVNQFTTSTS